MHVTSSPYAWFIFNLNTKHHYARSYITVLHLKYGSTSTPAPCFSLPSTFTWDPYLLIWRTSFLARDANVQLLLSLVCYQLFTLCCFTHPDTPHRSSYSVYIDDINNISHPVWHTYLYFSTWMDQLSSNSQLSTWMYQLSSGSQHEWISYPLVLHSQHECISYPLVLNMNESAIH